MEIFVAIVIIVVIAAIAFAVMQRRSAGARGVGRPRSSPLGRRERGVPRSDPMASAVAEHAQAMDPQDVVAAEQRMRAQARQVAAGLHADAHRSEHQRAADQAGYVDPTYDDPTYVDPAYDGRPAGDRVDPRRDDRAR